MKIFIIIIVGRRNELYFFKVLSIAGKTNLSRSLTRSYHYNFPVFKTSDVSILTCNISSPFYCVLGTRGDYRIRVNSEPVEIDTITSVPRQILGGTRQVRGFKSTIIDINTFDFKF